MGAGQKFVPNGVMLMCNGGVAPGRLNVIPKNVMLDGQIFATEWDTMPFVNIPSFGACQRLRYCPPCMPAPTGWKDVCDDGVKVMGARPLLEKSTNSCAIGGKITIMFVPPGGFSGSFTGITPSGLPDMSALTGGNGLSSLASNPAAAISNVGGVAALANVGSGGLTSITNLGSNVLSSAAGGVNALKQAATGQASGGSVAGGLNGITSGLGQMMSGFGQAASAIQDGMQQGNAFLNRINGYVGSVSQFGGTIARWTGNTRLQDAMMRLSNQMGNAKNKLNNTIGQLETYKDALSGANGYFGKATDFLNNFKKSMENGALGKQWTEFTAKLGTKAQSFFENFKRGISDLKKVKYPDTIAEWLKTSKDGLERLSGHSNNLSENFTNTKSYLNKSADRIKTFGGVIATLTGNPKAKTALSDWAAQWDNAANKMGNYATKANGLRDDFKNGAEFAQTGAEWAQKASVFLSKEVKTGDLKQQWDAFTKRLGNQASAFFDKIKTNAANLQNIPYPDAAAGWLAAGAEGFTRLSGHLNKATSSLNDLKSDLAKGAAQVRSFGGTLSRVTGNKKLEEWASKWDNASNKVGNAIQQGNKYATDAKSYGDKLKSGSQYVQKVGDFFKKYENKTPVGNPFQNWGTSVSNWVSGLKNLPIEAPRAGSVKELLGDVTKVSDKIGANMTSLGEYLGKSVQRANEFAGVLSLLDKDAAAKVQKLAAETAALQQKAAEIKAKAAAVKAKIEKAKQDLDKAKAALQKASAYWDKMKEKLPDFTKGADLFQQYLPKLPEMASIAAVSKAFPAIDSIANASQVANMPIANAFSSSITNSFASASDNNVITNDTASSVTKTGAVKNGSVSVSASGGGGMGVVNGSSRIGTVNVQKVSVSLPDMSDKNPNQAKKQNNNATTSQNPSIKPVNSKPDSSTRKQAIEMAIAKNKAERAMKLAAQKVQQQTDNEADRKKVESLRWETEEKTLKKALDDKSKKDDEHKKQISEGTHTILSGLGFIPGVGTIAGVLNTSLYAIEGDWTMAGIEALAIIPVFGSIAKIGVKNGKKVLEISEKGIQQLNKLDKTQADKIWQKIRAVKKVNNSVSKSVIEISREMKTITIGGKDWKKALKLTTEQEGIVYILKDSKGEILKIGKTTRHSIDGRFSKYLTYANKTGKKLSVDIFTVEKNNIRSIESIESEIRKAWGADKVLPWDNSKMRLGRKGSGLPKINQPKLPKRDETKTDRLKKHVLNGELDAARRESAGEVVARKADGTPWNHVKELSDAQRGLLNRIHELKKRLENTKLSQVDRDEVIRELKEASKLLDKTEDFLPR